MQEARAVSLVTFQQSGGQKVFFQISVVTFSVPRKGFGNSLNCIGDNYNSESSVILFNTVILRETDEKQPSLLSF